MKKTLFYTSSYITKKLEYYQMNHFFSQHQPLLQFIPMDKDDHMQHILFYASLKKSLQTLMPHFEHLDESTIYGVLHVINERLYPFEQLRTKESLILVDNHCKPTTLSASKKKYHFVLNKFIKDIYMELQEEHTIQKYRNDFLADPNSATLIDKLYHQERLTMNVAQRIARKVPFYAKNSQISAQKDLEKHLFSLYMHHYIKDRNSSNILFDDPISRFTIHNEAWFNLERRVLTLAPASS